MTLDKSLCLLKLEAGLREPKPELYKTVAELYKTHSAPLIAETVGISVSTVRRAIKRHDALLPEEERNRRWALNGGDTRFRSKGGSNG